MSSASIPIDITLTSIAIGYCPSLTKLPWIMVAMKIVELFWISLMFYLYVYIPRKEYESGSPEVSNKMYSVFSSIMVILTFGMVILIILEQVYIARLSRDDIKRACQSSFDNFNSSNVIWYGCWIGLGFKYLDVCHFILRIPCYLSAKCKDNIDKRISV